MHCGAGPRCPGVQGTRRTLTISPQPLAQPRSASCPAQVSRSGVFLGPGRQAPFTPVHAGLPALLSLRFFAAASTQLVLSNRCQDPVWYVLCVHVPTSRPEGGFLSTGGAVQPLPWPRIKSSAQHGGGLGWRLGAGGSVAGSQR